MPDWFYRTVSRPMLYRLPPRTARTFALGFMGRLARLPLGGWFIDLLGHMRADERLKATILGIDFPSRAGLGSRLDVAGVALPALARFGVGFLTVGPVGITAPRTPPNVKRDDRREVIVFPDARPPLGLAEAMPCIREAAELPVPLIVRIAPASPLEARAMAESVSPFARLIALEPLPDAADGWSPELCVELVNEVKIAAPRVPILLVVRANDPLERSDSRLATAIASGASGVLLVGEQEVHDGGCETGAPLREATTARVHSIRARFGQTLPIIAAGGVHEPEHALELRLAGADLIGIDTGLVFNGPGLVKRTNDVLLYHSQSESPGTRQVSRPVELTWFWTMLMGAGMLFGSVLALAIAGTRVVLPYDEAFIHMTRAELDAINPRLLPFMAHDRVSVAGTMIAIGLMYVGLSLGGIRRGMHWAMIAVFTSAFVGFASFFLFLGFGYLDTLHAFVTACLLQLLLFGVFAKLAPLQLDIPPALRTDRAWRLAQWGQFLLILNSVTVLGAGLVISCVGVTTVFVPEDLEYMQTTPEQLTAANPRLIPLIAHDRATFGGMLVSTGVVMLLTSLWGFRAGNTWLWWTFFAAGLAGYVPAILVHYAVGYVNEFHLSPAYLGLASFLLAMTLSRPYLCKPRAVLRADWDRITGR